MNIYVEDIHNMYNIMWVDFNNVSKTVRLSDLRKDMVEYIISISCLK